ncbi:MAG TPA: ABC transporter substrate-binding protein [Gracilimonas sp.]|uniref:ABC transporter substrate-binding protein n=1 Tax=Gracilimonas sp. TaxID=1974203 RepID=UPI002D84281A|nr:ABC transporter substrate-binding protein [Gracilimonas sp.]
MKKYIVFLLPLFIVISCGKGPETVIVKSGASDLFTPSDSVFTQADTSADDFVHVKLGEIAPIESLDPLFASSNSEWRIIDLVYDGLISIDENGNISPALAQRWTANNNSTQFTFNLKTDVHFHDSPVFESGVGRKFVASDVKYIFERMADNDVPDLTANQFKNIRGFSSFHNEQTYVKDPARRVISSIEGIQVRNDSTVVFNLSESSPEFLELLAHPMASIYPKESVPPSNGPIQLAAGTGPFQFIQKEGNTHLLTVYEDHFESIPDINRLDIVSGLNEKDLFQQFAKNTIDAIIEVGPETMVTIADSSGNLLQSYYQDYTLQQSPAFSEYEFYYNKNSGQAGQTNRFISSIEDTSLIPSPALGTISTNRVDTTSAENSDGSGFVITHTQHPFELFLLDDLAPIANQMDISFSMNPSYAISDETTFSTRLFPDTQKFMTWKTPIYILNHNSVSGITLGQNPWSLDVSDLTINRTN